VLTVYATWPLLWIDPLLLFKAVNHFSGNFMYYEILYLGRLYGINALPWHYMPLHLLAVLLEKSLHLRGALRIGRVCTAKTARGSGLGDRLMTAALDFAGAATCVLDAQTYAEGFYARYGFLREGTEFLEDGIPHITMRRAPST
jgi:predicted GNAT family N-acyltransferase